MGEVKVKVGASRTAAHQGKARIPVRRSAPAPVLRLERPSLQPALKVGPAVDPLEHEAEAMAERVATMSAPSADAAPPPPTPGDPMASREMPAQDTQPNTDEFETAPEIPADHQDPEVPAAEDVDTANVEADEFAEIEAGEPASPEELLRDAAPAAVGREGGDAPSDVVRVVAQPGAGRPLPDGIRAFMEPRFGVSFADVRVHDAPADRRAAARIGARAFTHRQHIWMGEGESVDNRRLIAHELTHVVQQTRRDPAPGAARAEEITETDEAAPLRRGWAADKAESYARDVPGYTLLCVIIGKSPITGRSVSRNAENLIGGFLGLIPGGNALFEKLQESKALQRAFDWVSSRLSELNISWSRLSGLIDDFIDEMPAWDPIDEAKRIFRPLVNDVIQFAKDIKDKILEFIVRGALAIAGPYGEKIWGVIQKAGDVIATILKDPLGFAKNLVSAIVGGFKQFGARIWEHLKAGLMGWLFGTMQGAGIEMPEKLDFKGVVSIALQILGLTYANFRAILVKKLGKKGEEKVSFIEKSVEVVKVLVKEGFLGVWQRVLEMIEGFKDTVIGGIRDFVINTIVMGAIQWVAGLSNPIGGVVKICLSIYNMIVAFIERLDQIMDVANSIFSSIGAIAKGQTKEAANFIEKTIAGTIPLFLAFVAALIPVTGITKTIKDVIKRLQAPVKKAMEKMATFLVKKTKKLFSKLLGKVNKKRKLANEGFKVGGDKHEIRPENNGKTFDLKIASKPKRSQDVRKELQREFDEAERFGDDSNCTNLFEKTFKVDVKKAEQKAAKINTGQQKTSTKKPAQAAYVSIKRAAEQLKLRGECIDKNPFFEDEPAGAIIRAREPRLPEIEGQSGLYSARLAATQQAVETVATDIKLGARGKQRLSLYYENDHIPEKSFAKKIQEQIRGPWMDATNDGARVGAAVIEQPGTIKNITLDEPGNNLQAITVYRPLHKQKTKKRNKASEKANQLLGEVPTGAHPNKVLAKILEAAVSEMQQEHNDVAAVYNQDRDATQAILGSVTSGLSRLKKKNTEIFGVSAGRTDYIKKANKAADGAGSSLAMSGEPNFAKYEGRYMTYKEGKAVQKGNAGLGTYIEFDHIIEKALAKQARDLTAFGADISGPLPAVLEKKLDEIATSEEDRAKRKKKADARLEAIKSARIYGNAPVKDYDENAAGTVALYRPVHQSLPGAPRKLILKAEASAIVDKLVAYAVADDSEADAKLVEVTTEIKTKVREKFDTAIERHISGIKSGYEIEAKQFAALNKNKEAMNQMAGIISRVGITTRKLHAESLALLGSS